MQKQHSPDEEPPNRVTLWRRTLSGSSIGEAKEWQPTMRRLSAGTENPPNKVIRMLSTTAGTCITTAMVCRGTESRPTIYSSKLQLRATKMLSGRLSVTGRGFQSTPVRAFGAFNKSLVFLLQTWKQGMSVEASGDKRSKLRSRRTMSEMAIFSSYRFL